MSYELKDKVVFLTGGASGIGAQTVKLLLDKGVKHVSYLDISEEGGKVLEKELRTQHGEAKVKFHKCDVSIEEDLFATIEKVMLEQEYVDIVINNAAVIKDNLQGYRKEIEINYTAVVASSIKFLEIMRKDKNGKGGTILNVSSIASFEVVREVPIYCGTKAAVTKFTSCLGSESYFLKTGVRLFTLCFPGVKTPLHDNLEVFEKKFPIPTPFTCKTISIEEAALAMVAAIERGTSGSTWLTGGKGEIIEVTKGCDLEHVYLDK